MNQDIIDQFRNPRNPFETAGGIARRHKFEEARRVKKPKPTGKPTKFADIEIGQTFTVGTKTIYTKTEPVKITTGPKKGKEGNVSYELNGTKYTVCDPEAIVYVEVSERKKKRMVNK